MTRLLIDPEEGYYTAHDAAIVEENRVNGNTRGKQYGSHREVTMPYTDKNGKIVHVTTTIYDAFGKRKVIKVTQA